MMTDTGIQGPFHLRSEELLQYSDALKRVEAAALRDSNTFRTSTGGTKAQPGRPEEEKRAYTLKKFRRS